MMRRCAPAQAVRWVYGLRRRPHNLAVYRVCFSRSGVGMRGCGAVAASPMGVLPLLRRQVELAVILVFKGVQRALPVLFVAVAALDAGVFYDCGHGGSPCLRSASDSGANRVGLGGVSLTASLEARVTPRAAN